MKVTIEPIKLSTLPEMFGGTADFLGIKQDSEAVCICTDSREACEGAIFVAIKGENTDGHKYINKAVVDNKAVAEKLAKLNDVDTAE